MGKGAGAFYSPCVSPLAPAGGMVHFFPSLAPMKLRRLIFRVALFRSVSVSACLAAGSAQAQWATINTISNPPGAFTITCTDFPVPGPQQVCAVSPPLPVGSTVRGNCGGVRLAQRTEGVPPESDAGGQSQRHRQLHAARLDRAAAQVHADRSQDWARTEFARPRFVEQVLASWALEAPTG